MMKFLKKIYDESQSLCTLQRANNYPVSTQF